MNSLPAYTLLFIYRSIDSLSNFTSYRECGNKTILMENMCLFILVWRRRSVWTICISLSYLRRVRKRVEESKDRTLLTSKYRTENTLFTQYTQVIYLCTVYSIYIYKMLCLLDKVKISTHYSSADYKYVSININNICTYIGWIAYIWYDLFFVIVFLRHAVEF